jgi:hypothetical protein
MPAARAHANARRKNSAIGANAPQLGSARLLSATIPKMDRHNHFSSIFMGLSSHLHTSSLISFWQRFADLQAHRKNEEQRTLIYQERKVNP